MNRPEDERDPRLEELLAGYRDFLDQEDPSATMPDDVTAQIRKAIAREAPVAKASRPRNRSMFALAASVTLIGAGLGATALVTSQGGAGSDPIPIRAGAGEESMPGNLSPLPDKDFIIEIPSRPEAEVSVVVPDDKGTRSDIPVVFVLDGKTSAAATSASSTCSTDDACVAVLIPSFESIVDPQERAATQLAAVEASKTELTGYEGLSDSWLVYGDIDSSDPVIVAGLQRGLFQQLDDLQQLD